MKRSVIVVAAVATLGLSACTTFIKAAQGDCREIGYTPGTAVFANCVERRADLRQEAQMRAGQALMNYSAEMEAAQAYSRPTYVYVP